MADFDPTSPFFRQQGLAAGLSRRQIQGRDFRHVVRGIYVARGAPELESRIRAGLLATKQPGAFASHHEAARLWGAVVPHSAVIHVSVPRGTARRRCEGVQIHSSSRMPVQLRGVPVTSPEDTFLDLAGALDLVDLVVLGDSLVRRRRVSPARLLAAAQSARGRYSRAAERAARLVRTGVDSPMETRARLLLVLAGLPEPEVNIVFVGEHGEVLRRLDLGYRKPRLAVEYDGEQHHKARRVYEEDVLRHEEFDGLGWRIIVLLAKDIYRTPTRTVRRVAAALESRGVAVPSLRSDYLRYFPDRERAA